MASNVLSNDANDTDGQSKVALLTGITGQVNKNRTDNFVKHLCIWNLFVLTSHNFHLQICTENISCFEFL